MQIPEWSTGLGNKSHAKQTTPVAISNRSEQRRIHALWSTFERWLDYQTSWKPDPSSVLLERPTVRTWQFTWGSLDRGLTNSTSPSSNTQNCTVETFLTWIPYTESAIATATEPHVTVLSGKVSGIFPLLVSLGLLPFVPFTERKCYIRRKYVLANGKKFVRFIQSESSKRKLIGNTIVQS